MQPLQMNLASRPFRNNTMLWIGHTVGVLLVVAFTAWNVNTYVRHGRMLHELRNEVDSFDNRMSELAQREGRVTAAIDGFDLKYLAVQADTANEVIRRRALSWTRLFNLMEKILPYEVRMTAIRPVHRTDARRTGRGERIPAGSVPVSVKGEAKTLEAFLEFERALLMDEHFSQVEPERSQLQESGEVDFELRFFYFPEGEVDGEQVDLPPMLDDSGRPITARTVAAESRPARKTADDELAGETPPAAEAAPTETPEPDAALAEPENAAAAEPSAPAPTPAAAKPAPAPTRPAGRPARPGRSRQRLAPTEAEQQAARDWTPFLRDESKMTDEEREALRRKRRGEDN